MCDSVRPHGLQPTRLPHSWDSPGKNTGVGCHFLLQSMKVESESEVAQSCPTLSDPMDCSLPGSSVHGIFQLRVLEWVAIAFSVGSRKKRKRYSQSRGCFFIHPGFFLCGSVAELLPHSPCGRRGRGNTGTGPGHSEDLPRPQGSALSLQAPLRLGWQDSAACE